MRPALLVLVLSARAWADDAEPRAVPCRPTVTCTADLAAPGTLQLEIGYQLRVLDGGGTAQTTPVLVKLPVARWLEAQLGTNGYTAAPGARYVDNVAVGAKLHVHDQSAVVPSLAVTASLSVPTAAQRGYIRTYDATAVAQASKDVGPIHLDLNLGLTVDQLGGPRASQPFAAIAATYAPSPRVALALEPHYFADAAPLAARDGGAIAAVEVTVRTWLVFDGAIDAVGWGPRSIAMIAGMSIAPAQLWSAHR